MCLTIPGRIESLAGTGPLDRSATVNFEGLRKTVQMLYLPEARVGEYVLVQAGFAIARVPEEEALEALRLARAPLAPALGPRASERTEG